MDINGKIINIEKFNLLTKEKWANENLEFFKCGNCDLILLGVPSCHIAFIDPENLNKTMSYNIPRKIFCPNCNIILYDYSKDEKYKIEEISIEQFLSSNWNKVFEKKMNL